MKRRADALRPARHTKQKSAASHAHHINYRWAVLLILVALAIYYLLPRLGELGNIGNVLRGVDTGWLLGAVAAALVTFLAAATTILGSTSRRLPWGPTLTTQIAATVLNRITPKGIGSIAVIEQYLEKRGLKRAEAAASVTLIYSAGVAMHLVLLVATVLIVRPGQFDYDLVPAGRGTLALLAIVGLLGVAGLLLLPRFKRAISQWAAEVRRGLRYDIAHPLKLLQLLGGSAAITLLHVVGLYCALRGVGADVSVGVAMLVYLGGSAVASASPTPGGLGAIEAALALGLAASGLPLEQAIAGVLVFRLTSFWLPILPGLVAFRLVIKHKLI